MIGSVVRVDPKDKRAQIIALAHTRELANQIAMNYQAICQFETDIKIVNLCEESNVNGA